MLSNNPESAKVIFRACCWATCPVIFAALFVSQYFFLDYASASFLIAGAFCLLGLWFTSENGSEELPSWMVHPGLLFLVYTLVSVTWSRNPGAAWLDSARIAFGFMALLTFARIFRSEEQKSHLLLAFFLCSIIPIAAGLIQLFNLEEYSRDHLHEVSSFFIHKNLFAQYLVLVLGIGIYLIHRNVDRFRWAKISLVSVISLLIFVLQARGAIVALVAGGIAFGAFALHKTESRKLGLRVLGILGLALVGSAHWIWSHVSNGGLDSMGERWVLWQKSLNLVQDNAVVGVGADNWQFEFMQFGVADLPSVAQDNFMFTTPHNEWLQLLCEFGIVGIIIVAWPLIEVVKTFSKASTGVNLLSRLIVLACMIAVGSLMCYSFPLNRPVTIFFIALILALFLSEFDVNFGPSIKTRWMVIGLAILITIPAFFQLKGEYFTRKLLDSQGSSSSEEILELCDAASSPFYQSSPTGTPIDLYRGQEFWKMERWGELRRSVDRAFALSPYDVQVIHNRGIVYAELNRSDEAQSMFRTALEINPYYERSSVELVRLLLKRQQFEQAKVELQKIEGYAIKYPELSIRLESTNR